MPIPPSILAISEDDSFFWEAGDCLVQAATRLTGADYDFDVWERELPPIWFAVIVLNYFLGVWENGGSFVDSASCWSDERVRVKKALVTAGCEFTAARFDEALALEMEISAAFAADGEISPAQEAHRTRLSRETEADVTYAKLRAFIMAHEEELFGGEFSKIENQSRTEGPAARQVAEEDSEEDGEFEGVDNSTPEIEFAFDVTGGRSIWEISQLSPQQAAEEIEGRDDFGAVVPEVPLRQTSYRVFVDFSTQTLVLDPEETISVGAFVWLIAEAIATEMCPHAAQFGFRASVENVLASRVARLYFSRQSGWWHLVLG